MCGITGIYKINGDCVSASDVFKMSSVIRHRGPDEAGYALMDKGRVAFGHVRLSIIDLVHGQQPMFNNDYTIGICFNGELYDYKEIRNELIEKGHKFKTNCDTEVIIHLYQEYDLDFFNYLNGEFAFLLWDENKKRLLAVKDRCGIKPLYYRINNHEVLFASEVKSMFALGRQERKFCTDFIVSLYMGIYSQKKSLFEGIRSLKPGHYLMIDENRIHDEKPYWQQKYNTDNKMSFETAKEGIYRLFEKAVRRRMVADVPVGVYLSGGIDSTLVAAMMSKDGNPFKAFNISFINTIYDEGSIAKRNADFYGAEFESIPCTMNMLAEDFEKAIYHNEIPMWNPHSIAKEILSKFVRSNNYKVCITGEGADEVFAGYPYYKLEYIWREIEAGGEQAKAGKELWKRFKKLEYRSEGVLWDSSNRWKKVEKFFDYANFYQVRAMNNFTLLPRLFNVEALGITKHHTPYNMYSENINFDYIKSLHPLNATRYLSLSQLYNYIIPALGDRAEMANSIECRTPFMDRDLMEFAGKIPVEYYIKIDTLREKYILHEAFKKELPPFIGKEHKHPFLTPNWSRLSKTQKGKELFQFLLSPSELEKGEIFNPKFFKSVNFMWKILPKNNGLRKSLDTLHGMMLSFQMLYQLFIKKGVKGNENFTMINYTPNECKVNS